MGRNRNNRSDGGGGGGGRGRGGRGRRGRGRGGRGRGGRGRNYRNRPNETDLPDSGTGLVEPGFGLLELHPNGYGFLRSPKNNYSRERSDPFVPGTFIDKYSLREGVLIRGLVEHARRSQGPRLTEVVDVDGLAPEDYSDVKKFENLTPINPEQWLPVETGSEPLTTRVMDLLTPLGKGQRALIVAPPRTGKTVMLQHIS